MATSSLVCVSFPDFSIQILQRDAGLAPDTPIVIVPTERPTARITACNAAARELGAREGMAYSQALALSGAIRAGVVSRELHRGAAAAVVELLGAFAPTVETAEVLDGVFWLDVSGIGRLFGGIGPWFRQLGAACTRAGWKIGACRGWTRAGTLLGAIAPDGPVAFSSPAVERAWTRTRSIESLSLPPKDREQLRLVALTEVGRFIDVSPPSIKRRFSAATVALHSFLRGETDAVPVQGKRAPPELRESYRFEPPVISKEPVRRTLERLVYALARNLLSHAVWLEVLTVEITFERAEPLHERIHCGRATRDAAYLLRLLDLRFDRIHLAHRFVREVAVDGELSRGEMRQEELALGPVERGIVPAQLDRVIATLQAELGSEAVGTATVVPGRFPEERFVIVPLRHGRDLLPRRGEASASFPRHAPWGGTVTLTRIRRVYSDVVRQPRSRRGDTRVGDPVFLASAWWEGVRENRRYEYHRAPRGGEGGVVWVYRRGGVEYVQGEVA